MKAVQVSQNEIFDLLSQFLSFFQVYQRKKVFKIDENVFFSLIKRFPFGGTETESSCFYNEDKISISYCMISTLNIQ